VYVHSNQPDQEATATAAGYSHSYSTDGSGVVARGDYEKANARRRRPMMFAS